MATFTLSFVLTERTRREVTIEADSEEEAIQAVEDSDFETSDTRELDSIEWSVSDIETL